MTQGNEHRARAMMHTQAHATDVRTTEGDSMGKETDTLAQAIAAPNAATAARILGVNGKALRDFMRGTLGVHVSRADDGPAAAWVRVAPYAVHGYTRKGTQRAAVVDAYKDGAPVPEATA